MRHFGFLSDDELAQLFHSAPEPFDAQDPSDVLAVALGATLYCPATRPNLGTDLRRFHRTGITSAVVCLEDAVPDAELAVAEANAVAQLRRYAGTGVDGPLVFVRVRAAEQIPMIIDGLDDAAGVLTGFVLPKFSGPESEKMLMEVAAAGDRLGRAVRCMPVLESPETAFAETRLPALLAARTLLDQYRDHVLAVRIGATDLSSPFGLRRSRDMTVYDVRLVADAIGDIVNVFARVGAADQRPYVVTGPVWEYFSNSERLFKPQLRESPFAASDDRALRARLIASDLDTLIREVALDQANGLTGKTVIHPGHVAAVHALSVVTHEQFVDACDIAGTRGEGGVAASAYQNKMNESKPHARWAQRILVRARVFGVAAPHVTFVDLLGAGLSG